jgi:hypothetical protein
MKVIILVVENRTAKVVKFREEKYGVLSLSGKQGKEKYREIRLDF